MMMRRRHAFQQDPLRSWEAVNEHMMEKLHVSTSTQAWSAEQCGRTLVPWDSHRLARCYFFIMAKLHEALKAGDVNLAAGIVAQGLKYYEKIAIDHGNQDAAVLLLPWEDPPALETSAPLTHLQDTFAGLLEADEAALGMRYLSKMHSFNKVRAVRAKGAGKNPKGKGSGEEGEGGSGNSRPPQKR